MSWLGNKWKQAKETAGGAVDSVEHGAEAMVDEGEHLASEAETGVVDTAKTAYNDAADVAHTAEDYGSAAVDEAGQVASAAENGIVDTAKGAYHAVEDGVGHLAGEASGGEGGESGPGEWLKKGLDWGADAAEVAENAGEKTMEEIPLLSTAIHGTMGIAHTVAMVRDQHHYEEESDPNNPYAQNFDGSRSETQEHVATTWRDKRDHDGAEAKEQFVESVPLAGLIWGLGTKGGIEAHNLQHPDEKRSLNPFEDD
jgi:hypothetical protein